MAEVLFYHLTDSSLDSVLPGLLEKSLQRGWNAVVQTASEERRDALDLLLWTWRDDSFIGHGTAQDKHATLQPVILTDCAENPNGARIRFMVDGAEPPPLDGYERAVLIFDGHDDEQLRAARKYWKIARASGHQITYWQQTAEGRWEKKG